MQILKVTTTPPPTVPVNYDRETLVNFACTCARDLASHLPESDADLKSPRSIEALQEIVNHRFPDLIQGVEYVKLDAKALSVVRGFTASKGNPNLVHGRRPGQIFLAHVENPVEQNFALAHELFQRVLDIPALGLPPLRTHINRVYNYMQSRKWREADTSTVQEFLPEIAAMEYFMPFRYRESLVTSHTDLATVVAQFQVPRVFASLHLSDDFMSYFSNFSTAPPHSNLP